MKPVTHTRTSLPSVLFAAAFLLAFSTQSFSAEKECEATVDMADTLEFHRMHMECNQDKKFGHKTDHNDSVKKDSDQVNTSPKTSANLNSTETNSKNSERKATPALDSSTIFEESAPFSVSGGPESARLGIFKRMAEKCPNGWENHQELVKPIEHGYLLSYRFSCL